MKECKAVTKKKYEYSILSIISKSLFVVSVDLLCNQESDMDSINLAKFMIELHETIDSFIKTNCV